MRNDMSRRVTAEFFGIFWLTFAGCGSAVLAAVFPASGIGLLGASFAFVLTMAYAVGHTSGGHFNPAVTMACGPPEDAPTCTCRISASPSARRRSAKAGRGRG